MPAGDYMAAASVSSPPFEKTVPCESPHYYTGRKNGGGPLYGDYGSTPGNIGNTTGGDFWTAARQIVDQVYQVLAPGAHSVWIVKSFVKDKQLVDFPAQWQALCEAAGFATVHVHRAWLIEDRGTQYTLDGGAVNHRVKRASFFRRLAEAKGSPPIDYEVVLCMEKAR